MAQASVKDTTGYVNYVYNISARGTTEVASQLMGMSGMASNILGQLAFQTSSYLSTTEGALLSMGVVATAGLSKATKQAMEFDQALSTIGAISGQTRSEVSDLGEDAMNMSVKFGVAVSEMTEGLESLARAGVSENNMTDILNEAMGLSKLEGLTLDTAINDLISTTNLLDTEGLDLESPEYADAVKYQNQKITATSEAAPIGAQDIIHTLEHIGGYASSTNLDQDDLYAVIAQLGSKGTKSEMAGTSLRAFISAGQKDTAQRALDRIGLNVKDLWKNDDTILSITDMKDVLDEAMEAKGYTQQEKLEFYSDFAGYKQANQIMKIDTQSAREFKQKIDESWDMGSKINQVIGTAETHVQGLIQAGTNLLTKVGEPFLPLISTIAVTLKTGIDIINQIPGSNIIIAGGLLLVSIKAISSIFNKIVPQLVVAKDEVFSIGGFFKSVREDLGHTYTLLKNINNVGFMKDEAYENEVSRVSDKEKIQYWEEKVNFKVNDIIDVRKLEGENFDKQQYVDWKKEKRYESKPEKRNARQSTKAPIKNGKLESIGPDIKEIKKSVGGILSSINEEGLTPVIITYLKNLEKNTSNFKIDNDLTSNVKKAVGGLDGITKSVKNIENILANKDVKTIVTNTSNRVIPVHDVGQSTFSKSETHRRDQVRTTPYSQDNVVTPDGYSRYNIPQNSEPKTGKIKEGAPSFDVNKIKDVRLFTLDSPTATQEDINNFTQALIDSIDFGVDPETTEGKLANNALQSLLKAQVQSIIANNEVYYRGGTEESLVSQIESELKRENGSVASFKETKLDSILADSLGYKNYSRKDVSKIQEERMKLFRSNWDKDLNKSQKTRKDWEKRGNEFANTIALGYNPMEVYAYDATGPTKSGKKFTDKVFDQMHNSSLNDKKKILEKYNLTDEFYKAEPSAKKMNDEELDITIDNFLTHKLYREKHSPEQFNIAKELNQILPEKYEVPEEPLETKRYIRMSTLENMTQGQLGVINKGLDKFFGLSTNKKEIEKRTNQIIRDIEKDKHLSIEEKKKQKKQAGGIAQYEYISKKINKMLDKNTDSAALEKFANYIKPKLLRPDDTDHFDSIGLSYETMTNKDKIPKKESIELMELLAHVNDIKISDLDSTGKYYRSNIAKRLVESGKKLDISSVASAYSDPLTYWFTHDLSSDAQKTFIKEQGLESNKPLFAMHEFLKKVGNNKDKYDKGVNRIKELGHITQFESDKLNTEWGSYTKDEKGVNITSPDQVTERILKLYGEQGYTGLVNHLKKISNLAYEIVTQESLNDIEKALKEERGEKGKVTKTDVINAVPQLKRNRRATHNYHKVQKGEDDYGYQETVIEALWAHADGKKANEEKNTRHNKAKWGILEGTRYIDEIDPNKFDELKELIAEIGVTPGFSAEDVPKDTIWEKSIKDMLNLQSNLHKFRVKTLTKSEKGPLAKINSASDNDVEALPFIFEGMAIETGQRKPVHGRNMENIAVKDEEGNLIGYQTNSHNDYREATNWAINRRRNRIYLESDLRKAYGAVAFATGLSRKNIADMGLTDYQQKEAERLYNEQDFVNIDDYISKHDEEYKYDIVDEDEYKEKTKAGLIWKSKQGIVDEFIDPDTNKKKMKVKRTKKGKQGLMSGEEAFRQLRGQMAAANKIDNKGKIIGNMFQSEVTPEEYEKLKEQGLINTQEGDNGILKRIGKGKNLKYRINDFSLLQYSLEDLQRQVQLNGIIDVLEAEQVNFSSDISPDAVFEKLLNEDSNTIRKMLSAIYINNPAFISEIQDAARYVVDNEIKWGGEGGDINGDNFISMGKINRMNDFLNGVESAFGSYMDEFDDDFLKDIYGQIDSSSEEAFNRSMDQVFDKLTSYVHDIIEADKDVLEKMNISPELQDAFYAEMESYADSDWEKHMDYNDDFVTNSRLEDVIDPQTAELITNEYGPAIYSELIPQLWSNKGMHVAGFTEEGTGARTAYIAQMILDMFDETKGLSTKQTARKMEKKRQAVQSDQKQFLESFLSDFDINAYNALEEQDGGKTSKKEQDDKKISIKELINQTDLSSFQNFTKDQAYDLEMEKDDEEMQKILDLLVMTSFDDNPIADYLRGTIGDVPLKDLDKSGTFYGAMEASEYMEDFNTIGELSEYVVSMLKNEELQSNSVLWRSGRLNTDNDIGVFEGITSTSLTESYADTYSDDNRYKMKIFAPAGIKGMKQFDNEFVLNNNTPYITLSRDDENKMAEILLLTDEMLEKLNLVYKEESPTGDSGPTILDVDDFNKTDTFARELYKQGDYNRILGLYSAMREGGELLSSQVANWAKLVIELNGLNKPGSQLDKESAMIPPLEEVTNETFNPFSKEEEDYIQQWKDKLSNNARKTVIDLGDEYREKFAGYKKEGPTFYGSETGELYTEPPWEQDNARKTVIDSDSQKQQTPQKYDMSYMANMDIQGYHDVKTLGSHQKLSGYKKGEQSVNKIKNMLLDSATNITDRIYNWVGESDSSENVNKIDNFTNRISNTTEVLKGFSSYMQDASEVFPPLIGAVVALEGVINGLSMVESGTSTISGFLNIANQIGDEKNPLSIFGHVIEEDSNIAKLLISASSALNTVMSSILSFVEAFLGPLILIGTALAATKIALDWSYQSHEKYLKSLEEEQKSKRSKAKGLQPINENAQKAARENTAPRQQDRLNRNAQLAQTQVDNANMTRTHGAIELTQAKNDTLWGDYGIASGLGKISGNYESTAQEYEGTTEQIRKIKEETLANPFASDAMRQSAAYYDANQLTFGIIDEYKDELGKLYDSETSAMLKYKSDDVRESPEFQKALDDFVEATGITRDHAKQYLDYMQTEHEVDKATQSMQAQADQISASTELKVQAIAFGGNPADVLGLNGIEAQQDSMIKAQADMIKLELSGQLWWKAVWATISSPFKLLLSPLLVITDLLGAIWSLMTGNWSDAFEKGGRAGSRLNVFGEAATYWGAWADVESTDFNAIGQGATDSYNRANYGNVQQPASGGYHPTHFVNANTGEDRREGRGASNSFNFNGGGGNGPSGNVGVGGPSHKGSYHFVNGSPSQPMESANPLTSGGGILSGIASALSTIIGILTTGLLAGGGIYGIYKFLKSDLSLKDLGGGILKAITGEGSDIFSSMFKEGTWLGKIKDKLLPNFDGIFKEGTLLGKLKDKVAPHLGGVKESYDVRKDQIKDFFKIGTDEEGAKDIFGNLKDRISGIKDHFKELPDDSIQGRIYNKISNKTGGILRDAEAYNNIDSDGGNYPTHIKEAMEKSRENTSFSTKMVAKGLRVKDSLNKWKDYGMDKAQGFMAGRIQKDDEYQKYSKSKRSHLNKKQQNYLVDKYLDKDEFDESNFGSSKQRSKAIRNKLDDMGKWKEASTDLYAHENGGYVQAMGKSIVNRYTKPWREYGEKQYGNLKQKAQEYNENPTEDASMPVKVMAKGMQIKEAVEDPDKMIDMVKGYANKYIDMQGEGSTLGKYREKYQKGKEILSDPAKAEEWATNKYQEIKEDPALQEEYDWYKQGGAMRFGDLSKENKVRAIGDKISEVKQNTFGMEQGESVREVLQNPERTMEVLKTGFENMRENGVMESLGLDEDFGIMDATKEKISGIFDQVKEGITDGIDEDDENASFIDKAKKKIAGFFGWTKDEPEPENNKEVLNEEMDWYKAGELNYSDLSYPNKMKGIDPTLERDTFGAKDDSYYADPNAEESPLRKMTRKLATPETEDTTEEEGEEKGGIIHKLKRKVSGIRKSKKDDDTEESESSSDDDKKESKGIFRGVFDTLKQAHQIDKNPIKEEMKMNKEAMKNVVTGKAFDVQQKPDVEGAMAQKQMKIPSTAKSTNPVFKEEQPGAATSSPSVMKINEGSSVGHASQRIMSGEDPTDVALDTVKEKLTGGEGGVKGANNALKKTGKITSKVGKMAKGKGGKIGKVGNVLEKVGGGASKAGNKGVTNVAKSGLGKVAKSGVGKAAKSGLGKVAKGGIGKAAKGGLGKVAGKVGGKVLGKVGGKIAGKVGAQVASKVLAGGLAATGVGAPLAAIMASPIGGFLMEGAMDLGGKALGAVGGAVGNIGKAIGGFLGFGPKKANNPSGGGMNPLMMASPLGALGAMAGGIGSMLGGGGGSPMGSGTGGAPGMGGPLAMMTSPLMMGVGLLGSIFKTNKDQKNQSAGIGDIAKRILKNIVDGNKGESGGGNGGSIKIQNININTADDPEAIKAMFLELLIELQEQVNPRLVSRTAGQPPASNDTSSTDTSTETEDQTANENNTDTSQTNSNQQQN